jgi:ketosteroid isomerase-like protein
MPTPAEANVALLARFFGCLARAELTTLRTELLSPDVRWHIAGRHPLSGTHLGPSAVLEFFAQLGKAGFATEVLFREADEHRAVQVHRAWTQRGDGNDIDLLWVLICRVSAGRIIEAWSMPSDQAAADAFFHASYPLAELPARLAAISPN